MWIFIGSILGLYVVGKIFAMDFIEKRKSNVILHDPILKLIPEIDVSYPIIILEVSTVCLFVYNHSLQMCEIVFMKYVCCMFFKIFTLFVTPLKKPISKLVVKDVITERWTNNKNLENDLFFSGHTTFVSILMFNSEKYHIIFIIAFILMTIFLLLGRLHYTIDIAVAPFIAFSFNSAIDYFLHCPAIEMLVI